MLLFISDVVIISSFDWFGQPDTSEISDRSYIILRCMTSDAYWNKENKNSYFYYSNFQGQKFVLDMHAICLNPNYLYSILQTIFYIDSTKVMQLL